MDDVVVTVRTDVPGAATDEALSDVPRADEADSNTVPENPDMLPTVIVEVPEFPGAKVRLVVLADSEKFGAAIVTGTVTVCVGVGLVPTPFTETEPLAVPLTVRVVLTLLSGGRNNPASAVLAVNVAVAVVVKVMKSVKPPKLVTVMVEVPGTPDGSESEDGEAVIPKSVRLEKVAPRLDSLSGVPVPFDTVTAIRLRLMLEVSAITL